MKSKNYAAALAKKGTILLCSVLLLAACKKDKAADPPVVKPSKLALVVSSPGAPELSFFANGTKVTTSKALNYNTVIDYMDLKPGTGEFSFRKKDATDVLAKINYTAKTGVSYTLLVADKSPKAAVVLVEDDLSAPATDKAKVRFVNLSPETTVLDLYVAGKTEAALSKKAFKEASAFVNVDPAVELKFEIKENGKTDVLATLDKFKVEKGKIYTVWVKGLKDATDATKLGVEVMTNK
ncbi:hypothetical protein DBR11_25090 [Pedobacter sp. HMWF019]|uniref:DUF4397 domain-containing protein n=1 Tax=Pedobacter sp. HMWF019 TaxID=2056856 RepID=UPI000D3756DC|nr:DUF4397 domain-containing protein [Pedobacter sp. HMWF019]PTS93615.1 hypothetical protein DBR11_25090 [Pedobacter sp. HMWF019]